VFPEVVARLRGTSTSRPNDDDANGRPRSDRRTCRQGGLLATAAETLDWPLRAHPQLQAVCLMAVGYNNIDVAACTAAWRADQQCTRTAHRDHGRPRLAH
jgi:gluconate 2-dehydrogenase